LISKSDDYLEINADFSENAYYFKNAYFLKMPYFFVFLLAILESRRKKNRNYLNKTLRFRKVADVHQNEKNLVKNIPRRMSLLNCKIELPPVFLSTGLVFTLQETKSDKFDCSTIFGRNPTDNSETCLFHATI
jgi:hypothetical protein